MANINTRAQSRADRVWLGSPWEFQQRGESGLWVSDLLPHIASVADELCVVRSMVGKLPLHGQQNLLLHTGRVTGMAPSFGSWVSYGLGTGTRAPARLRRSEQRLGAQRRVREFLERLPAGHSRGHHAARQGHRRGQHRPGGCPR